MLWFRFLQQNHFCSSQTQCNNFNIALLPTIKKTTKLKLIYGFDQQKCCPNRGFHVFITANSCLHVFWLLIYDQTRSEMTFRNKEVQNLYFNWLISFQSFETFWSQNNRQGLTSSEVFKGFADTVFLASAATELQCIDHLLLADFRSKLKEVDLFCTSTTWSGAELLLKTFGV